jgi:hypothetical protein
MKIPNFNLKTFLITLIICCVLSFVSLVAFAATEEGTNGNDVIVPAIGNLFYIFRFPMHTIFSSLMSGKWFLIGLFINCLFYAFFIERYFTLKNKK